MEQWEVARCGGVCAATGKTMDEGEEHYAVLFEEGDSFRREDHCLESWQGPPPEAYCFFKTRVRFKEKKKRLLVDDDVLVNFFLRLAQETEDARIHFRFVLALILMRKRILRYENTEMRDGCEYWLMRLAKDSATHTVCNPNLDDAQIERVSHQLGAILHGDMGDFDELAESEEPADADADGNGNGDGSDGDVADVVSQQVLLDEATDHAAD